MSTGQLDGEFVLIASQNNVVLTFKEKAAADERARAEVEAHRRELAQEKARLDKEREQLRQQQTRQSNQTQKNSNTNGNRR